MILFSNLTVGKVIASKPFTPPSKYYLIEAEYQFDYIDSSSKIGTNPRLRLQLSEQVVHDLSLAAMPFLVCFNVNTIFNFI